MFKEYQAELNDAFAPPPAQFANTEVLQRVETYAPTESSVESIADTVTQPAGLGGNWLGDTNKKAALIAGIASLALVASLYGSHTGSQSSETTPTRTEQTKAQLITVPVAASVLNKKQKIGTVDLQAGATVNIPILGFTVPLMFRQGNNTSEPVAMIKDTVNLTLTPSVGKDNRALPIATLDKINNTYIVNRNNVNVMATMQNYNGLNIDCIKQAQAERFCVAGMPAALRPQGKVTPAIANKINNLLMPKGKDFSTYYEGVKAKLVMASLEQVGRTDCGNKITNLADQVITNILHKQRANAAVAFVNGTYPLESPAYNNKFAALLANKTFSIERGDAVNKIPDSLQLSCQVQPPLKGSK